MARFNTELARRFNVPHLPLFSRQSGEAPLLSLKWAELDDSTRMGLHAWARAHAGRFDVFWHDGGDDVVSACAFRCFAGDATFRADALGLWAPPLVVPVTHAPFEVSLLTFGMAHKLQTGPYRQVQQLLERANIAPRMRVSVALHEATSLEDVTDHFDTLRDLFGLDRVQVLGVLSDTGLAEALRDADVLLAFFGRGVRANNTTVHAAMAEGCPVLTLLDADSPADYQHGQTVMDLAQLDRWPALWRWQEIGANGAALHRTTYTWDKFMARLEVA